MYELPPDLADLLHEHIKGRGGLKSAHQGWGGALKVAHQG